MRDEIRYEDSQDSEGQSHHAVQQAMQADLEGAFERISYDVWYLEQIIGKTSTEEDLSLIAWGLGVTDLYKRLK